MPPLYILVKFVHVALAVVGVGTSAGLGLWLELAPNTREHEAYALRAIRFLEYRFVVPMMVLLLLSGWAMVSLAPWPLDTPWIVLALALWGSILLGMAAYHPILRRQIGLVEAGARDTPHYRTLALGGRLLGGAIGLLFLVIVYLMVVKPGLWG